MTRRKPYASKHASAIHHPTVLRSLPCFLMRLLTRVRRGEIRTAFVTLVFLCATVPFVLCVISLYGREVPLITGHRLSLLHNISLGDDGVITRDISPHGLRNGSITRDARLINVPRGTDIRRTHDVRAIRDDKHSNANFVDDKSRGATSVMKLREKYTSSLRPFPCQTTQKYASIKQNPKWVQILRSRFNNLVSNLSSAVDVQWNATVNSWQENLAKQRVLLAAAFKPIITSNEFITMIGTFYTLADALHVANITYFLYGGSAIGAYRHMGLIPWDDDIDIMISSDDVNRTRDCLSSIPGHIISAPLNGQWKFFMSKLTSLGNLPHRWPFVDIFFYDQNETHIWDIIPAYRESFVYSKHQVFPLQYRPFEGGMAPVPCHLEAVLDHNYDTHICRTSYYLHKYEVMRDSSKLTDIHCSLLHSLFPFVYRKHSNSSKCVRETLKIGNVVLASHTLPKFCGK